LCGGTVYELNQNAVRISRVQIYGADQSLAAIALATMQGNYLGIIPRDSTFFFSASNIRANLLAAHPEIAAVSIFRNGFTGLSIKMDTRVPIARWCGSSLDATTTDCYIFDAKGFVYATTSPDVLVNSFSVYESISGTVPIGSTLPNAREFPSAFDFARQLDTLGSPVIRIIFRGDEVDDYLASDTRITYILGDEQNAFTALASARVNFNLADGSVEYVDLRFDGKVYLKKE
jgi:hypothetical protein